MDTQEIRKAALHRRRALIDRREKSERIIARLWELPEMRVAETVLWYVSARSEVETFPFLSQALQLHTVVTPYCVDGRLELRHIDTLTELAPGAFGILEPINDVRTDQTRHRAITEIDLVVTPGSAFDRTGGRLGYGKGYYDRLLAAANRERTTCVALAFDCQIVPALSLKPHDVRMDMIVTESETILAET